MLDKKHVVNVPKGAIVRSNRIVLWTIEKRYSKTKQYNNDARRQIGKTLETDRTKMYPNDNYKELFPDGYNECLGTKPSPSWQSIGLYTVLKAIAERLPLYDCLYQAFGKQDKQVFRVKAYPHSLVHDIHMAHILLAAADFVLTFEDQDAVRFQNSVCLSEHIRVAAVQALFIGIYTETPADDVAVSAVQRFSFCC